MRIKEIYIPLFLFSFCLIFSLEINWEKICFEAIDETTHFTQDQKNELKLKKDKWIEEIKEEIKKNKLNTEKADQLKTAIIGELMKRVNFNLRSKLQNLR